MKKISVTALLLAFILLIAGFIPTYSELEIYDKVIRLHVLASSDSEEDQLLKLKVRDGILEYIGSLGNFESKDEAAEAVSKNLENIRLLALSVIENEGFNYRVEVTLSEEYYQTREYEGFSLPAGEYQSLRVMIGEAQGHNWWCVLYPPLCLSASADKSDELVQAGFTQGQVNFITENDKPRYKIKFRIIEFFNEIKKSIFG